MKPRHLKLLALLLPLFIARSLVPIGFMLSFDGGVPALVFCPSQMAVPNVPGHGGEHETHHADPAPHHEGAHQHHHHGDDHSDGSSVNQQSCPFAFAAAAPLGIDRTFALEPPPSEAIAAPPEAAIRIAVSRAHAIRGPPALS